MTLQASHEQKFDVNWKVHDTFPNHNFFTKYNKNQALECSKLSKNENKKWRTNAHKSLSTGILHKLVVCDRDLPDKLLAKRVRMDVVVYHLFCACQVCLLWNPRSHKGFRSWVQPRIFISTHHVFVFVVLKYIVSWNTLEYIRVRNNDLQAWIEIIWQ